MHGAEVLVWRTYAHNLGSGLDGIGELGVHARDESVSLAGLYHHHAEVVALEHLVVGLLEGVSVALALLGEDARILLAAVVLAVMAEIDNFDAFKRELEFLCLLLYHLLVAKEYW